VFFRFLMIFFIFSAVRLNAIGQIPVEKIYPCKMIDNKNYVLTAALLKKIVDHIYDENEFFFKDREIEKNDLCIKISDDKIKTAYVINNPETKGIIYYGPELLREDIRDISTVAGTLAHEMVHIAHDHGNSMYSIEGVNESEKVLIDEYEQNRKITAAYRLKLDSFIDILSTNKQLESFWVFKKLKEDDFFSRWLYPRIDSDALSKTSILTNEEKEVILDDLSQIDFSDYETNGEHFLLGRDNMYKLERRIIKSYDQRHGQNRFLAFTEIQADEQGLFLASNAGFNPKKYFVFTFNNGIFEKMFFNINCKSYKIGMSLRDVSLSDDISHPDWCWRRQNIQRIIMHNETISSNNRSFVSDVRLQEVLVELK